MKITIDNHAAKRLSTRDARKIVLRVMRDRDLDGHLLLVLRKSRKSYTRASALNGISEEDSKRLKSRLQTKNVGWVPHWTLTISVPELPADQVALLPYRIAHHVAWWAVWAAGQKRQARDAAFVRRLAGVGGSSSGLADVPKTRTNRRDFESAIAAVTRRVCEALRLPMPMRASIKIDVPISNDVPLSNAPWGADVKLVDEVDWATTPDGVITKEAP